MNQISNTSASPTAAAANSTGTAAAVNTAATAVVATLSSVHPKVLPPNTNESALGAICLANQANWVTSDYGPTLTSLNGQALDSTWAESFFSPITELGLLAIKGADAKTFLQGQLTNDIAAMAIGQTLLAGYCTAKGRLLATMHVMHDGADSYNLLVSRPLAAALRKRLAMYVMRSKCVITDLSDSHLVIGFVSVPDSVRALCIAAQAIIFDVVDLPTVADVSPLAKQRFLTCVSIDRAVNLIAELSANLPEPIPARNAALWRWTDCRTGQPLITAQTSELFVPQMVNLDLVDGVSFKKGCYPGQEVVARSHYLGRLKRRMFLGHAAVAQSPGSDVVATGAHEPVGQVVMAGPHPNGGFDVLFESQIEAALNTQLMIGDAVLARVDLPYTL